MIFIKKRKVRYGFIFLVMLLTVSLLAGCSSQTSPTSNPQNSSSQSNAKPAKGTINIGYVNWAEDIAVTNLWKVILEEQGYKVDIKSLDVAPLFVGLDKGDLDLFMDSWLPVTHQSYWDKYKNNLEDFGAWYDGKAKIGLVVPKYVTAKTISELNNHKDKFNGELIGIDPGAGIMKATNTVIKEYGLDYKLVQGSEAAMMAAMEKANRSNKWIAITGWSPHWMFAKYDLKYLEDPKKTYGDAEGIHTLANKEFSKKNPEVAAMIKKFKMNDQQIGTLEGYINDGMSPIEASKKWINENKTLVNSWIK